jgi:hypothetical protein
MAIILLLKLGSFLRCLAKRSKKIEEVYTQQVLKKIEEVYTQQVFPNKEDSLKLFVGFMSIFRSGLGIIYGI